MKLAMVMIEYPRSLMKQLACSTGGITILKDRTKLFAETVVSEPRIH